MKTDKQLYKDTLGWGTLLWLFGYILGIVFFFIMSKDMIGWVITPIATLVTLWVLTKKIKSNSPLYFFLIAVIWTVIAMVLDYFFIVKAFNPEDGYYKLDVYIYYTLTFILPLIVGWRNLSKANTLKSS